MKALFVTFDFHEYAPDFSALLAQLAAHNLDTVEIHYAGRAGIGRTTAVCSKPEWRKIPARKNLALKDMPFARELGGIAFKLVTQLFHGWNKQDGTRGWVRFDAETCHIRIVNAGMTPLPVEYLIDLTHDPAVPVKVRL